MYAIKRTALQRNNAQVIAQCLLFMFLGLYMVCGTPSFISVVPSNGHVNLFPAICTAAYTVLSLAVEGKEAYMMPFGILGQRSY